MSVCLITFLVAGVGGGVESCNIPKRAKVSKKMFAGFWCDK